MEITPASPQIMRPHLHQLGQRALLHLHHERLGRRALLQSLKFSSILPSVVYTRYVMYRARL